MVMKEDITQPSSVTPYKEVELWFGDERGYNATIGTRNDSSKELWFGDERGYNATDFDTQIPKMRLWFGDERGYNATPAFFKL